MQKMNEVSKLIYGFYLFYLVVHFIVTMSILGSVNNFTFNLFTLTINGGIALALYVPYIVAYNIFLFIFVCKYSEERNLPGFLWLLISILMPHYIGLIAFIVAVRYPKIYKYLTVPRYLASEIRCGQCGDYLNPDYNGCPNCGHMVKKTCTNCGHEVVNPIYKFCDACGTEYKIS